MKNNVASVEELMALKKKLEQKKEQLQQLRGRKIFNG